MSKAQGLLGIICFLFLAYLMSERKKAIRWKLVLMGLGLQFAFAIVLDKISFLREALFSLNYLVQALDTATKAGSSYVFGYLGGAEIPFTLNGVGTSFNIAFQILPIIVVVSALSSLLFYWGILGKVISGFSWLFQKTLKIDGATSLGVASSIFLGIIESPVLIKDYLPKLSRSGLFMLITAGMATVAGTVMVLYATTIGPVIDNAVAQILIASLMSAPAAIIISQIIMPSESEVLKVEKLQIKSESKSAFEALIDGTSDGVHMSIQVAGVLIVLFAMISLLNQALGLLPFGEDISVQKIAGYLFVPLTWLMGISNDELLKAGELMGTKLMLNEFVAYLQLGQGVLKDPRNNIIMTYAMCGFANFGSLGILTGGLGSIMPDRKTEIAALSFKAVIAGTLSTMMTGAIIGLLY